MNVQTEERLANIAISKNIIKEYKTNEFDRVVYMNDGTEFQIHIKNPYQDHIGVVISLNGNRSENTLVLKPGQSVWLERHLDNDNKYLFSTYETEDTDEMHYAIAKNGNVTLEFYKECKYVISSTMDPNGIRYREYDNWPYSFQPLYAFNCSTEILDFEYVPESSNMVNISASIETGRVEQGSRSEQKFSESDIKFEYFPFKRETMVILPNSRKQISADETRRRYCTNCGKKASPKDKFCSNCGAKLK